MAAIDTKIAALQSILPTIDSQKYNDLQNIIAGKEAGIFTSAQLAKKVSELEVFVQMHYGTYEAPAPTPQVPIDETDLAAAEEHGFSVVDGIEGHYDLKRFGEMIYQIPKNIGKTDFQNIIEANKIKKTLPNTEIITS